MYNVESQIYSGLKAGLFRFNWDLRIPSSSPPDKGDLGGFFHQKSSPNSTRKHLRDAL